jgi:hypothetical protein
MVPAVTNKLACNTYATGFALRRRRSRMGTSTL